MLSSGLPPLYYHLLSAISSVRTSLWEAAQYEVSIVRYPSIVVPSLRSVPPAGLEVGGKRSGQKKLQYQIAAELRMLLPTYYCRLVRGVCQLHDLKSAESKT